MRPHTRLPAGFTTMEVIVVIGILSILFALVGPSMGAMIATQQVKGASFDLHATLNLARSEALTRNTSVTVAPAEGDWARGWTVTTDGTVLRRQAAYSRLLLSGPVRVVFNGDGRPDATATPFSVTSAEAHSAGHRCVRLRLNGRSAIDAGAC